MNHHETADTETVDTQNADTQIADTTTAVDTNGIIVALAHPSVEAAIAGFADEMRGEQRFFATATPKLATSSLQRLVADGGIRLGVMIDQRLIAMSRVERDGSSVIAVVRAVRGRGVGRRLLESTLRRAADHGHERVVFHSSRRSKAFVELAAAVGATLVDQGRGQVDLIFEAEHYRHIA